MATLHRNNSGEYRIIKGYPITRRGRDTDMFFTTLTVEPRAVSFFDAVDYRDGQQIPPAVFYALLVDGDLTSPSLRRRPATIDNVPSTTLSLTKDWFDRHGHDLVSIRREPAFKKCRYLIDFFTTYVRILPPDAASSAAHLCLFRHLLQRAYERERS